MLSESLLKKEVFLIRDGERNVIIYAPLTRFFCFYDEIISFKEIDSGWLEEATSIYNVPDFILNKGFIFDKDKIRLRLNITSSCNLGCDFCSVKAFKDGMNMSESLAFKTVSYFINFAELNKAKELEVVFSGGEPTLMIHLIKKIIDFSKEALFDKNIKLIIKILTNGLFSQDDFLSILNDVNDVQISWDGLSGGSLRYKGNKETLKKVWENIGFLSKQPISLNILSVVSEVNFMDIEEIVDDLYQTFGLENIFLSLKENIGKSKKLDIDFHLLGERYISLWRRYREKGIEINMTGTDIHSVSAFPCSVPIPNYSVSPEGIISACTITFNSKDKFSKAFEIGRINEDGLILDEEALSEVRNFNVLKIPSCEKCFAKWHCKGGCIYSKKGEWFSSLDEKRCEMTKFIIVEKLKTIINEQS